MRAQSHTKRTHKCKSYCFGVLAGPVGSEQREWGASPQTPRQQPDRNFPRLSASPPGAGAGPGPSITPWRADVAGGCVEAALQGLRCCRSRRRLYQRCHSGVLSISPDKG